MDNIEIRQLIRRFLSGYVFLKDYIIDTPSEMILSEGDHIYNDFIYDNRFEELFHRDNIEFVLMKYGLWSLKEDSILKEIPKRIEDCKVNLYQNFHIPTQERRLRTHLSGLKTEYNKLMTKKMAFDHYTIENLAEYVRDRFIFSKIILNKKYKKAKIRPIELDRIIEDFKKQHITIEKYRRLAKNDEWMSVWSIGKNRCFRVVGEEQRILTGYTKMYINILKNPECPSESILCDDDALDGWMIHTKRQYEKERKQKKFKIDNDKSEQFIMVDSNEDVEAIYGMNDTRAKIIQAKIHNMVKDTGKANEFDIQEIRQDAIMKG